MQIPVIISYNFVGYPPNSESVPFKVLINEDEIENLTEKLDELFIQSFVEGPPFEVVCTALEAGDKYWIEIKNASDSTLEFKFTWTEGVFQQERSNRYVLSFLASKEILIRFQLLHKDRSLSNPT